MKAIAIGCMWFASKDRSKDYDEDFSSTDHLNGVVRALEKIDAITRVKVDNFEPGLMALDLFDDDEQPFFPIYASTTIRFSLYVPKRIQPTYHLGRESFCSTEHFDVTILYGYSLPVTFVSYSTPDELTDIQHESPSSGIVIVREYLTAMLTNDQNVSIETLGPSPMHVDVILKCGGQLGGEFEFKDMSYRGGGYRRFLFTAPTLNDDAGMLEFMDSYADILGAHYDIMRFRERLVRQLVNVQELIASLLPDEKYSWLHRRLKRYFTAGSTVEKVLVVLLRNQLTILELHRYATENKRDGTIKETSAFYPFIGDALAENYTIPSEEIRDIVGLYEERRLRIFEIAAVVLAAVIGGTIGALVTMTLSSS